MHTPQAKTGGPEKTTVVERPKAPPAGKSDEQPAPSLPQQTVTVVNANAAVVKKSAPPSAQPSRGSSFKKTASPKTDVAAKVDSSPKDDAQAKAEAHKPTVQSKKEVTHLILAGSGFHTSHNVFNVRLVEMLKARLGFMFPSTSAVF